MLLLSSLQGRRLLAAARQAGVDGYCPKGITVAELVVAIRQVAAGRPYWQETGFFATLRNHIHLSGLRQIDTSLAEVTAQLQPGLPLLKQTLLTGQRRELLACRWLVNQLWAPRNQLARPVYPTPTALETLSSSNTPVLPDNSGQTTSLQVVDPETGSQLSCRQSAIFESTLAHLQFSLENLTRVPLEIDIFREDKKRELHK